MGVLNVQRCNPICKNRIIRGLFFRAYFNRIIMRINWTYTQKHKSIDAFCHIDLIFIGFYQDSIYMTYVQQHIREFYKFRHCDYIVHISILFLAVYHFVFFTVIGFVFFFPFVGSYASSSSSSAIFFEISQNSFDPNLKSGRSCALYQNT